MKMKNEGLFVLKSFISDASIPQTNIWRLFFYIYIFIQQRVGY